MNAEIKPLKTAAEMTLASHYEAAKPRLPGGADAARMREHAFASFVESGLPHRRVEAWKYTDLRLLLREAMPLSAAPESAAIATARGTNPFLNAKLRTIVLMDGTFVPELSDLSAEKKLTIVPLARALADRHPLTQRIGTLKPHADDPVLALNTAFLNDGVLIEAGEGALLERPIHVRHIFSGKSPAATYARLLFVAGNGANATLVESFEGPDGIAYQVNSALELHVGDKANVALLRLQAEGNAALHLSTLLAEVGHGAELELGGFTQGAAVSRHTLHVRLAGEHTDLRLANAKLLRGKQHGDTTLVLHHAMPNCTSREIFRTVLDDAARGVVQGLIVVQPDAQKTDARMSLGALMLAEGAEADQKPELEIFADDVQCGHGATAGALDEQLLFYLMTRGIPRRQAEALLVQSFVSQALEQISHEGVRTALIDRAVAWLAAREHIGG
jgi:Fe-S cluster assembly protein SufD